MTKFDYACLSIVVPAYNEEQTISSVLLRLLKVPHLLEIIVVDDFSSDRTPEILMSLSKLHPNISFVRHTQNRGKTAALVTGFQRTTGGIVMVQDADLEYDPADIPGLIAPILEGHADVVFGSRFLVRKAARVLYFYHYLANKVITLLSNCLTNINLTDVETGYKAFRGEIIREMLITSSGFGFEIEVTAKAAKLKCAIYETPISYYGRTYEEGKKITYWDGIAAFYYLLRFNLLCSFKQSFKNIPATTTGSQNTHVALHSRMDSPRSPV
ncbi:MAG: glycosyltransferase family 2 protein [Acidobacteriota bacterium]|nr:glycosyltransferase family 2 protein [Acidobacteriota bacterium]